MIEAIGGKRIHPAGVVPGGMEAPLPPATREEILAALPEALAAAGRALGWYRSSVQRFEEDATRFGAFPSAFMGLVGPDGSLEHYNGTLRVVGADGAVLAERADPRPYWEYLGEAVIRRYDPCLSCSTHVIGQMPLHVSLLAPGGAASPRPRHPGRPGRGPLRPRPPVVLVAVAAASLEAGDRLSPALERALPEVVEVVLRVAARYRLTAATREGRRGGAGPGGG